MRSFRDASVLLVLLLGVLTFRVTPLDAEIRSDLFDAEHVPVATLDLLPASYSLPLDAEEPISLSTSPCYAAATGVVAEVADEARVATRVISRQMLVANSTLRVGVTRSDDLEYGTLAISGPRVESMIVVFDLSRARKEVRRYCDQLRNLVEQFPGGLENPRIHC